MKAAARPAVRGARQNPREANAVSEASKNVLSTMHLVLTPALDSDIDYKSFDKLSHMADFNNPRIERSLDYLNVSLLSKFVVGADSFSSPVCSRSKTLWSSCQLILT